MTLLQRIFFRRRSDAVSLTTESLPWIDANDVKLIENSFIALNKKHIRVFEWGPGGSTIYFSNFLREQGISYDWYTVENNKKWHENLLRVIGADKNIHTALYIFSRFLPGSYKNRDFYVKQAKRHGQKFDFILVDGRERSRCLILSRELLNKGGVIFLHDAERSRYQAAMLHYPSGKLISLNEQKRRLLWRAYL